MRAAAVCLGLLGCARFELDENIELVPSATWTDLEYTTLVVAAECWALAFGIPFAVVDVPSAAQTVNVQYNELVCWRSEGRFTPGQRARIDVCPPEHWQEPKIPSATALLATLMHELGHAAGIRVEGKRVDSVTGGNIHVLAQDYLEPAFSSEDHRLMAEAAPGVTFINTCHPVLKSDRTTAMRCACP